LWIEIQKIYVSSTFFSAEARESLVD
jgi:hypothetical protein